MVFLKNCSRYIGAIIILGGFPPLLWQVELEATAEEPGTTLRAPTLEGGLAPACRDTCSGVLRLQMWERRSDGSKGKVCCLCINCGLKKIYFVSV